METPWTHTPRLIYLANQFRVPVPPKILNLLPEGQLIGSVATRGLQATAVELKIPQQQLQNLYEEGRPSSDEKITEEEFRYLLGAAAMEGVQAKDLRLTEELSLTSAISDFVKQEQSQLIEYEEVSLANVDAEKIHLPMFESGFQPLDVLLGGIAQTLITLIARPGHGKSSTFLALMGELRRTQAASSIWFFSLEMPKTMLLYRASPLFQRVEFKEDDRLYCGSYTPENILDLISKNPDPNRVIIYDSPDALGGGSDQRRFVLEDLYRDLVKVKTNSKAVFTASQPRRTDRILSLDSVAESWSKAWYSDTVITLTRRGNMRHKPEYTSMALASVKNRFGISDQEVRFGFNYGTLEYEPAGGLVSTHGWDEPDAPAQEGENPGGW